jgi:hypothetical protein
MKLLLAAVESEKASLLFDNLVVTTSILIYFSQLKTGREY